MHLRGANDLNLCFGTKLTNSYVDSNSTDLPISLDESFAKHVRGRGGLRRGAEQYTIHYHDRKHKQ
jgi:hypothetical protein